MSRALVAKAASLLLRYPDGDALAAMPLLSDVELPADLAAVVSYRADTGPTALAAEYVQQFDLRRRSCLYLSYYTAGDTRVRGAALLEFAAAYKAAGYAVDNGELPDYLPAVLDLAAVAGEPGWSLLHRHRVGLELLHQALSADGSVYRYAVAAVLSILPPVDRAAVVALARTGPLTETVGLQPFAVRSGGRP
jgi:nitrate reductase molybdenum cofactor assembly chaperone NarJ/NarW